MENLEYEISRLRKLIQKPIGKKFTERLLLYPICHYCNGWEAVVFWKVGEKY